jgi:hypothetical protein
MSGIPERVALGAAFLDEHDHPWWREDVENAIDLDRLDMECGDVCVLGQRCPFGTLTAYLGYTPDPDDPDEADDLEFRYHSYALRLSGISPRESMEDWAVAHGFNRPFGGGGAEYRELTAEWARVIRERRAA